MVVPCPNIAVCGPTPVVVVQLDPDRPVLIDKYLDRADELDVDALCDKDGNVVITGIMQHIEQVRLLQSSATPRASSLELVMAAAVASNWKSAVRLSCPRVCTPPIPHIGK